MGNIKPPNRERVRKHKDYDRVSRALDLHPVFIVGPTGNGKTHMARQMAEDKGLRFYFTGAVDSEYKLRGFRDAHGNVEKTDFRKAFEEGGLFLFDEVDRSNPQALVTVNAALSNGFFDAPDKLVHQHPDFRCIASANTFGRGSDGLYVGANRLDASSIARFLYIEMFYDHVLELNLAGVEYAGFCVLVQCLRASMIGHKIRHTMSTRDVIFGSDCLKAGFSLSETMNMAIWRGLDTNSRERIITDSQTFLNNRIKNSGFTAELNGEILKFKRNGKFHLSAKLPFNFDCVDGHKLGLNP